MDFVPRLMFIPLQLLFFVLVARGQNSISSSIVCLNATTNTPCGLHSLTCPANTSIFILEAENGFAFSPSHQSSCAGSVCDQQCCSRDNFQCSEPMSNLNFGVYFSNCWGRTSCTTLAVFDARTFTDGNSSCSGESSLAFVSHQCIANSSVLRFDDGGSVSGTAVVARYLNTETNTSSCLEPNNTLECDVTLVGSSASTDVRVMMALSHTRFASQCSTLSIANPNVSTGVQSCRGSLSSYNSNKITVSDVSKNLKIALTLHKDNLPWEAWAVVTSNTTTLRMTCGKGTCTPSRESSASTQTPSTSASTSQAASTSTSPPTPAVEPSTITVQLGSTSASKPTSLPTTAAPGQQSAVPDNRMSSDSSTSSGVPASSSHSDVSALVTAVVVLSVLCLVLVLSLIALAIFCWRRRPLPRDPTYSLPMNLQLEERQYETLDMTNQRAPRPETNSVRP